MKQKERKNTNKMQTRQRNAKKRETHSNPIYTNTVKNFPNRGDDLVRLSIEKLKINCPKLLHIKSLQNFLM